MSSRFRCCFHLVVALCVLATASSAQPPRDAIEDADTATAGGAAPDADEVVGPPRERSPDEVAADIAATRAAATEDSLLGILIARKLVAAELRARQNEILSDQGIGRQAEIEADIAALSQKVEELDASFSEIAAGVDTDAFKIGPKSESVDMAREFQELLSPLIKALKRASSRPREIDRLRSVIAEADDQLDLIRRAIAKVSPLSEDVDDEALREKLAEELASWQERQQAAETRHDIAVQKLDKILHERTTFSEAVENVFEIFFRSRGRNLVLALLMTAAFLIVLRKLHREAMRTGIIRNRENTFWARVFNLLFVVFTLLGGVLVFLVALYLFGDWVLLIVVLMLILGALWTSKQAIPKFWMQGTLLLDMGPVREGERLEYEGLPYRVEKLNFYTDLVNPELTGGTVRLPIGDLGNLRSRPFDPAEPWFPTRTGDWVLLDDGSYGQVALQSIDVVDLRLKGDSHKIYPTADFLEQRPVLLTTGFRARSNFRLDYGLQAIINTHVIGKLDEEIRTRVRASFMGEHLEKSRVSFEDAGDSALVVRITADFRGEAANLYKIAPRLLRQYCIDVCNENGWKVPFEQVQVHVSPRGE